MQDSKFIRTGWLRTSGASGRHAGWSLLGWVLVVFVGLMGLSTPGAWAKDAQLTTADLVYMNRLVYTMRATIGGAPPAQRADRALGRLQALEGWQRALLVDPVPFTWNGEPAVTLRLGDYSVLTVFPGDIDPDTGLTLQELAERTRMLLQDALRARLALDETRLFWIGIGWSALGLAALLLAIWVTLRGRRLLIARMQAMVANQASTHRIFGIDWSDYALSALVPLTMALTLCFVGGLIYVWLGWVFNQFLATQPLAADMGQFILDVVRDGLQSFWKAVPSLVILVLIASVARGVTWMLSSVFDGVERGRFSIPGVHADTVGATRRLATAMVWTVAFASMYPYIPGSQSEVFRVLSVLIGFVLTLGSAGVAAQVMSGVVLVYSRALRVGDFVRIGEVEGFVIEMGALSLKLVNHRGDVLTVPNNAVLSGHVHNFSKRLGTGVCEVGVTLTIGYDAPWRQVYALLQGAAQAAPGVRAHPKPFVLQRKLNDFYVEYELIVQFEDPRRRAQVLSSLHEAIQDAFNAAGVQIMSPHFQMQPAQPVTVPTGPWFPREERARARAGIGVTPGS